MPAQPLKVFPGQGTKLRYLIRIRGDRRPAVESQAKSRAGKFTHDEHGRLTPLIRKQEHLAAALHLDKSRVSDWVREQTRIPDDYLTAICRIFAVGEAAFRTWSFEEFETGCKTGNFEVKPDLQGCPRSRWRSLLRERNDGGARLLFSDPRGDPFAPTAKPDLRHARVGATAAEPVLPEVASETSFWLALASPQAEDGSPLWAGWHLLLLNHDRRLDSFACPLAHGIERSGSVVVRFPDARTLYLPHRAGLRHPASDCGAFAMIAVVCRLSPPENIVRQLAVAEAHGPELEPALQELASWIAEELTVGATAIVSVGYRVVEKSRGVESGWQGT